MSNQDVSLPPKLLLGAINNNFEHHFFNQSRESAKIVFQSLLKGEQCPFMRIDMGDAGEVQCELSLDTSLYVGKLNFGKFKKLLATMMIAIKERIEADAPLNALNSKHGEIMFNIPGIVKDQDGRFNVMVTSFRQLAPGLSSVRLMFLDPQQYADALQLASQKVNKEA